LIVVVVLLWVVVAVLLGIAAVIQFGSMYSFWPSFSSSIAIPRLPHFLLLQSSPWLQARRTAVIFFIATSIAQQVQQKLQQRP